jgi:hypothetical protein
MDSKVFIRMDRDWKSREEYEKRKRQEKVKQNNKVKAK